MFVLEHINNAVSTLLGLWALWNYRILSQVFLLVGMFLLFSGVSQFIAYFLAIYFQTNMVFYGIALVIHLVLVSAIFYQLLEIPKNKLRLLVVAILGGLPIASLSIYQIILDSTFSFFAIIFSNVLFTTFAYLYLYSMLLKPKMDVPWLQSGFWLASGFFFYNIASIAFWILQALMHSSGYTSISGDFFDIHSVLSLLFYLILGISVMVEMKIFIAHGNRG